MRSGSVRGWRIAVPALAVVGGLAVLWGCTAGEDRGGDPRPRNVRGYAGSLQLELRETAGLERRAEFVRAGLPFPRMALARASNLRAVLSDGREIDSQRRVLSRWPDGSVRWIELGFEPSVAASAVGRYRLEFGPRIRAGRVLKPLRASQGGGFIRIDTGRLKLEVIRKNGRVHAWFDRNADGKYAPDELALAGSGIGSFVRLRAVKKGALSGSFAGEAAAELEESGPLRASVVWRGWHLSPAGRKTCPYVMRMFAYRGNGRLRLRHTLVLSEPATESAIEEAGLAVDMTPGRQLPRELRLLREIAAPKRYPDLAGFKTGFRMLQGNRPLAAWKTPGAIEALTERFRLLAVVPRPETSAPCEMRVEPRERRLVAAFWPKWGGAHFDRRSPDVRGEPGFEEFSRTESYERFWRKPSAAQGAGAARTHELLLEFLAPGAPGNAAADLALRARQPLLAWPGRTWFNGSGVFGSVSARGGEGGGKRGELERGEARLSSWLRDHQCRRFGWMGIWDYGDYQTVYRRREDLDVGERWWNWHGQWGWMQGRDDLASALLVPWVAAGRPGDWERFRAAAAHNLDVDTVHATGREAGMVGATHGPGVTHWSTPAALGWTYPASWLDLHYLGGERRGLSVLEILLGSIGGRNTSDFGNRQRGWNRDQAGYLRVRLAAHEAFGREHAAAAARALEHFARIPARELGRSGWARELVPALIRYHRLTGNPLAARLIDRGTQAYLAKRGPAARGDVVDRNCYDACAYAWRLTGDRWFLERGRELALDSAAGTAGSVEVESESAPPADLAEDARTILEVGTLPYLEAAIAEAENAD